MLLNPRVGRLLVAGGAVMVIAAPTAAYAASVSYSSDRGRGSGSITWTGTKNYNFALTVLSSTGVPVYTDSTGFRDNAVDASARRVHGDTTSRTGQRFTGTVNGTAGEIGWSGVYLRHCENKAFVNDYCGPRSSPYRRP